MECQSGHYSSSFGPIFRYFCSSVVNATLCAGTRDPAEGASGFIYLFLLLFIFYLFLDVWTPSCVATTTPFSLCIFYFIFVLPYKSLKVLKNKILTFQ